jgi:hypothetical protein
MGLYLQRHFEPKTPTMLGKPKGTATQPRLLGRCLFLQLEIPDCESLDAQWSI